MVANFYNEGLRELVSRELAKVVAECEIVDVAELSDDSPERIDLSGGEWEGVGDLARTAEGLIAFDGNGAPVAFIAADSIDPHRLPAESREACLLRLIKKTGEMPQ